MLAFVVLIAVLFACSPALAQSSHVERHGAFILLGSQSEVAILAGDLTAQTPASAIGMPSMCRSAIG